MSPFWGSKSWQACSAIFIIFILGYGTLVTVLDLIAGHPLWWYNLSFVLFGLAIFGLLMLVREGYAAFSNFTKYGRNPDTDKIINDFKEKKIRELEARKKRLEEVGRSSAENYPVDDTNDSTEDHGTTSNYLEDDEV